MAAAVFEFGIEEASPREKMLANLVDCVVALLTATQPASSAVRPRYGSKISTDKQSNGCGDQLPDVQVETHRSANP